MLPLNFNPRWICNCDGWRPLYWEIVHRHLIRMMVQYILLTYYFESLDILEDICVTKNRALLWERFCSVLAIYNWACNVLKLLQTHLSLQITFCKNCDTEVLSTSIRSLLLIHLENIARRYDPFKAFKSVSSASRFVNCFLDPSHWTSRFVYGFSTLEL